MDQKISAWFIHLLGKEKWKAATAKKPFILPFGDGNEMFLSVNWFATVTLRWF